jgi:hypothetical protein
MQKLGLVGQHDAVVDPHRRQHTPREAPNVEKRRPVDQNQAHERRGVARGLKRGKSRFVDQKAAVRFDLLRGLGAAGLSPLLGTP